MLQAREDRLCSHSEKVALTKEVVDHTERVRNSSGSELVSSPESHKDPDCSVSVSRAQFYQRKEARHAGPMCMPLPATISNTLMWVLTKRKRRTDIGKKVWI